MTDCSICYDPIIDFPAASKEATGSHRSSCGHIFHPKCIAKWHKSQERSTCPLCRTAATDLEDCSLRNADAAQSPLSTLRASEITARLVELSAELTLLEDVREELVAGAAPDHRVGGSIRTNRERIDFILRQNGGLGMTVSVEGQLPFEGGGYVVSRDELERILQEQGGNPFSDAMWTHLMAIYPDYETEPFATAAPEAPAPAAQPPSPVHYIDHPCPLDFVRAGDIPPSYGVIMEVPCDACNQACTTVPFYHCDDCQFDVCLPCLMEGSARAFMQRIGL